MQFPEHDKLDKIKDRSRTIGEFLEWMRLEQNWTICKYDARHDEYGPVGLTIEQTLAKYFKIDENRLEAEKRAMLALIRDPSMKTVDTVE